MRHKFGYRKLNRTSEHRKALFKNMLNALIKYEQITTTLPKAKELKPQIDKIITLGKRNNLQSKKNLFSELQSKSSVDKLLKMLPDESVVLGLDEHTGLLLDFSHKAVSVVGKGSVHLIQGGYEKIYTNGPIITLGKIQCVRCKADYEKICQNCFREVWGQKRQIQATPMQQPR